MTTHNPYKLMLCQYPNNGFGGKNNQFYLLDQFGHRFDFKNEYDKDLDERFWSMEINGQTFTGNSPLDIVETMKINEYKIRKW